MSEKSPAVAWADHEGVLFDLDGVLTPTAEVHMRAWSEMFNGFLTAYAAGECDIDPTPGADTSPYTDADYFAHVDGKPRYDGVRDFLTARGIELPEDSAEDTVDHVTVSGLGDRKNHAFNEVLARDGVAAYPGSVALLDHLRELDLALAVVSSSVNAPAVLAAAGIADRFHSVVDGEVAREAGLAGKPAPDTFLHAATALGVATEAAVVVEDAVSGVRAGAAGGFAMVIGVDRGAGDDALREAGATLVVSDLAELVPGAVR